MLGQKRRFFSLALIMILLVAAISAFSTRTLYITALKEQRTRLLELVKSQASLTVELGWMALELEMSEGSDVSREDVVDHIVRAHKKFQMGGTSGEFTVGKRVGQNIQFLIVNGRIIPKGDPLSLIPLDGPKAEPMERAIFGQTGTVMGIDYKGDEVLAAYTPLPMQTEFLGLVAKVDTKKIKAPFIRANIIIFSVGLGLLLVGLGLFYKLSEPIIKEIHASEKNYRDLVEHANSFILRINTSGTIVFANEYAESQLGPEDKTMMGLDLSSLFEEWQLDSFVDIVEFFGDEGARNNVPTFFPEKEKGWTSWTAKMLINEGKPNELLCIGRDVTTEYLATEAQKEIEERFRGIATASPVGIAITDMDGNLIYANERMHNITGAGPVELSGVNWLERIHEENRQSLFHDWFEAEFKRNDRQEIKVVQKEGRLVWVLAQIVDLKSMHDDVIGNILTFTDITKMKEAELAQSRLTAAIEQAAEMIILTDLDANITYVNPAFCTITGYTREEAIGNNPRILNSGEKDTAFYEDLWSKLTIGNTWHGRFTNIRKDGKRYTQESTIGPIRDTVGSIIGYVGVARDISDQLISEAQLRQAQKLESIGELAAGIAHEINTPTQYVNSNMQFLADAFETYSKMLEKCQKFQESVKGGASLEELKTLAETVIDEEELKYLAEDIPNALTESETGLERIAEIVQSVKQLAHPGETSKSYYNLNEISRDAATVSANEWKYVTDIDFDFDEDLPSIYCLKGEVGQVLLNLIVNSAHAMNTKFKDSEEKGRIGIKTYVENENVVIEVSDNGSGMPEDVAKRAFDPFFTTKDVGKGTGQGLAITHNVVVNMHGGSIDVETEEGVGTTFTIKLPVEEA
ncbi:PAS domain S-box protein [Pseudodesulfovibrio sp.]|nr:PAS domain S-box protein [Pseudodesulfovibrio sp.]